MPTNQEWIYPKINKQKSCHNLLAENIFSFQADNVNDNYSFSTNNYSNYTFLFTKTRQKFNIKQI